MKLEFGKVQHPVGKSEPRVNLSFDDLIRRTELLLSGRDNYYQPARTFWSCDILTEPGYKIADIILNVYSPEMGGVYPLPLEGSQPAPAYVQRLLRIGIRGQGQSPDCPQSVSACVHGHVPLTVCFASSFCHIYGYRPTGSENPFFIKHFYERWPDLR